MVDIVSVIKGSTTAYDRGESPVVTVDTPTHKDVATKHNVVPFKKKKAKGPRSSCAAEKGRR